jgi:hypothetical protein
MTVGIQVPAVFSCCVKQGELFVKESGRKREKKKTNRSALPA